MRAKLIIDVSYDEDQSLSDKDVERVLNYAAMHLANNGLLSGECSVVDEWTHSVKVEEE